MEKEFIEYEQALELKELGFNEPCLGWYLPEIINKGNTASVILGSYITKWNKFGDRLSVPTFSQAFRFFREKYGLFAEITLWGDGLGYISMIKEIKQEEFIEVYRKDIVDTGLPIWKYEEAELACLKKLIEIVKKQKEDESNIIV